MIDFVLRIPLHISAGLSLSFISELSVTITWLIPGNAAN